jgi:hypothetical protein
MRAPGFFGAVAEGPREDLLGAYLDFLEQRNGTREPNLPYPRREDWLSQMQKCTVRYAGTIDPAKFEKQYATPTRQGMDLTLAALLAFVKVNAGEAYGVEVVTRRRHGRKPRGLFERVERLVGQEETYHTRILLGATRQFDVPEPQGAWRPSLPLQLTIGALAFSPKSLFHPVLLGSEVAGVFTFNWMLSRVGELFGDQPQLCETLEARLLEILIDEIGHIAFNRMAVGPLGMASARALVPLIADGVGGRTVEFRMLGWNRGMLDTLDHFDLGLLPEEVRRRAFFV